MDVRSLQTTLTSIEPWRDGYVHLLYPQFAAYIEKFKALGGVNIPAPDNGPASFFSREYTDEVLRALDFLKGRIAQWPILHDPQLHFDFFATSGNLRFYFKEFEQALFIELYPSSRRSLRASLWMLSRLRSLRSDRLFGNVYAHLCRGGVLPRSAGIRSMECQELSGDLQISISFTNFDIIAEVLEALSLSAKTHLCLPLSTVAQTPARST